MHSRRIVFVPAISPPLQACRPQAERSVSRVPGPRHGFALILVLLLLSVGLGAAIFAFINSNALQQERDRKTAEALAQTRAALIAWAVSRMPNPYPPPEDPTTSTVRPGEFPCPDNNAPGSAFYGAQSGTCGGASVALGRVPWRTLGIPEPKDGAGETLWYAVANPFRRNPPNSLPINSDTRGNITVFGPDGVTPLTTEAVAVIFAPGPATGGQTRGGANQTLAANYLETSNGINNADTIAPTGPFIAGRLRDPNNPTYNDRVLYITTRDFIPLVEMRVGAEIKARLEAYRSNSGCQCYPWADTWPLSDSISDLGVNRGRFPLDASPESWGQPPGVATAPGVIPSLPRWFGANEWQDVIYYSVARQNASGGGLLCQFCSLSPTLTVDGQSVSALIFTPGTPRNAGWRVPDPKGQATDNDLTHYLEDAQNNAGGHTAIGSECPTPPELGKATPYVPPPLVPPVPASCDQYVTPTSTVLDRDRVFTLTSPGLAQTCAQNATALLELGPCGPPPKLKAQCVALAASLAVCGCAAAANVMITVPCMNTFNPKECQTAVAQLRAC